MCSRPRPRNSTYSAVHRPTPRSSRSCESASSRDNDHAPIRHAVASIDPVPGASAQVHTVRSRRNGGIGRRPNAVVRSRGTGYRAVRGIRADATRFRNGRGLRSFACRYSLSATALLCCSSCELYTSVTRRPLAADRIGCHDSGRESSSRKYRARNSGHFSGSWLNHFLSAVVGPTSFSQASTRNFAFESPRGHSRSTRRRVPSSRETGS